VQDERRTWVWIAAVALLLGLATAGVLVAIGAMWYAFGLFGMLVLITVAAIGVGWAQGRRDRRREPELRRY